MKYIALFIVSLSILGCDSDPTTTDQPSSPLIGHWVWAHSDGGFSGNDHYYPAAGESQRIVFTSEGKFSLYCNDTLMETATYYINPNDSTLIFHPDSSLV